MASLVETNVTYINWIGKSPKGGKNWLSKEVMIESGGQSDRVISKVD